MMSADSDLYYSKVSVMFAALLGVLCLLPATSSQNAPTFSAGVSQGRIDSIELDEASGLAASRLHPGILYSHNDHGDRPRIFAINATDATVVATLEISPAYHNDWEDIAVGPCSNGDKRTCIYILDDGRYHSIDMKTLYRVVEPDTMISQTLAPDSTYKYNWTERASNTVMVDNNGEVYIIGNVLGGRGMIAMLPSQAWGLTDPVSIDSGAFLAITSSHTDPEGGDISPDGREVLIKQSGKVIYWSVLDGDITAALTHPGVSVPYHSGGLGESICWAADGSAYYTLSEGSHQPLYMYTRQ